MSVARGTKILIAGMAIYASLAHVLPNLLASHTIGLPLQRAVMLLQPQLEDAVKPYIIAKDDAITGLIVLGGNSTRVTAAKELLDRFPGSKALFSGLHVVEVALVKRMDVDPMRIVMDDRPTNTYENAYFTNALALVQPGDKWLLVTSAMHMPRALATFRDFCLDVQPWPVRDALALPYVTAPVIYYEIFALLVYFLKGRLSLRPRAPRECNDAA